MGDHHFLQNLKQSFSLAELDPITIDSLNHFPGVNPGLGLSGFNSHNFLGFPTDNTFPQLPDCPGTLESLPGLFIHQDNTMAVPVLDPVVSRKRKGEMDISTSERSPANSSGYSSPQVSNNGNHGSKTTRAGRGKKVKAEEEKPREVIHVRAKRGQATDSHSLAERVRRGKINERLRCLQDIVPGCYKTMGMAVMLDEIINYVQSLQNQVEFLSMKLTAASTFYDFNSDTDVIETIQRAKAFGAIKVENDASQGRPPLQFGPLGPNFGSYPQLPHTS